MVTGRFRTLEEAENVLRDGVADMVSLVRALIADPQIVKKTREGRVTEVRPCIACNQGCIGGLYRNGRLGCAVNPAVGFETQLDEELITKSTAPKKVLVIGGGPAGMEAARVAALRGHKVKLMEAGNELGGMINIAKRAPRMLTFGDIGNWLELEINRLGVEIELGAYVEADDIRAQIPDMVIVATGSMPRMDGYQMVTPLTPIKGAEQPHVLSSIDVLTMPTERLKKTAVVFDDIGHLEAIAVAEHLVEAGVAVTFVTSQYQFGGNFVLTTERDVPALERLYARGDFRVVTRAMVVEIRPAICVIRPLQSDKTEDIAADHVVLVSPNLPNRTLYDLLRDELPCLLIGDASSPRDVQAAIHDAHHQARAIA